MGENFAGFDTAAKAGGLKMFDKKRSSELVQYEQIYCKRAHLCDKIITKDASYLRLLNENDARRACSKQMQRLRREKSAPSGKGRIIRVFYKIFIAAKHTNVLR